MRLLPKSMIMWTCLASPAVAAAGRMQSSMSGTPFSGLPSMSSSPCSLTSEVAGQRVGRAEVADFRVAAGGIDGQEEPGRARLDDLPLDVGKAVGAALPRRLAAQAALPAVADLGGGSGCRRARECKRFGARVGEKDVHGGRSGIGVCKS